MSTKPQIELFLENENGTQQVAYPFVESDHVSLTNGMDIDTMIRQDVSMPTVTHEDLSFKVGVGDQDVSSAIVDSSVAEMTIKGKTYQNILPEPSTHVLSNNKEMFKVNEGLDPNVEIVDGVSKSAILTGCTLVNCVDTTVFSRKTSIVSRSDDGIITIPSQNGSYIYAYGKKSSLFKPSTNYTLFLEIMEFSLSDGGLEVLNPNFTIFTNSYTAVHATGYKKILLTTKDDISDCDVTLRLQTHPNADDGGVAKVRYMIIEGDYTNQDIPYFEGMQSVKMPVLTTTGKNLFDKNTNKEHENGFHRNADGAFLEDERMTSYKIEIEPNTNYVFSASINAWHSITYWDKNNNFIKGEFTVPDFYTTPNKAKFMRFAFNKVSNDLNTFENSLQIEEGSVATSYEPYKSNILSTPEDLELRGIGNVKDELNVATGELAQRIGEVILDGSESWNIHSYSNDDFLLIFTDIANKKTKNILCDKLPTWNGTAEDLRYQTQSYIWANQNKTVFIWIEKSKLSKATEQGFKDYLQSNPITIQYQLATESIKTVDLSSSGNWEKVILDGSEDENWVFHALESSGKYSYKTSYIEESSKTSAKGFCDKYKYVENDSRPWDKKENCISILNTNMLHIYNDCKTLAEFKQNLKQNPITLWYQTATHQDSTQVKQPIFFKDGHIQLSSGADNSLIPTLDYQAKTSNSYVMDLMKTNTKYTMKAKSASGTFTIDGTSYGAGTNGTFTTPSSMTNKFLVMSNNANEEIMILEGDVADKTIPYFKGIKSAFEDEDKIEVLSTGKNLFDGELEMATIGTVAGEKRPSTSHVCSANFIKVKPSSAVILTNNNGYTGVIHEYDKNYNYIKYTSSETEITKTTLTADTEYVLIRTTDASKATDLSTKFLLEVANSKTDYEPHKSNNTKIPLLSPLRSLPNGVCDELIIDRMKKKATLIQRIDKIVFDGRQRWLLWNNNPADVVSGYVYYDANNMGYQPKSFGYTINDRLPHNSGGHIATVEGARYTNYFTASIHKNKLGAVNVNDTTANSPMFQKWYTENPMTMYYELETPVITEVDLEGFPYIYKDGHIFLNSEIAPVTEIKYSINQQHQIEASNQDIIRHQKEIDYLYKLIGEYVRVDYKNTLLSLNLELK